MIYPKKKKKKKGNMIHPGNSTGTFDVILCHSLVTTLMHGERWQTFI